MNIWQDLHNFEIHVSEAYSRFNQATLFSEKISVAAKAPLGGPNIYTSVTASTWHVQPGSVRLIKSAQQ